MSGFIVTFTPCGHEQHYNGAPAIGSWCSCWWRPNGPGCQGSRQVKSVRPAPAQIVTCARCLRDYREDDPRVRYASGDWWCACEADCDDHMEVPDGI